MTSDEWLSDVHVEQRSCVMHVCILITLSGAPKWNSHNHMYLPRSHCLSGGLQYTLISCGEALKLSVLPGRQMFTTDLLRAGKSGHLLLEIMETSGPLIRSNEKQCQLPWFWKEQNKNIQTSPLISHIVIPSLFQLCSVPSILSDRMWRNIRLDKHFSKSKAGTAYSLIPERTNARYEAKVQYISCTCQWYIE